MVVIGFQRRVGDNDVGVVGECASLLQLLQLLYPPKCIHQTALRWVKMVNQLSSACKSKPPQLRRGSPLCREKDSNLHITKILVPKTSVSTNSTIPAHNIGCKFNWIVGQPTYYFFFLIK